ncbi:hypothetical protein Tco_0796792 [Tanacetum coccineum]
MHINKETMMIEESLNITFDESLPEPKSSSSVEDDRIDEPIVQDLNGSLSLQVNVSDKGYPKSLKEDRGHLIEQVIGELNERTLRTYVKGMEVKQHLLQNNQVSSPKSVLNNKAFEDSSSETDFNEDWYNIKDKGVDVVIPQTSSKEGEKESKALKLKASNNGRRKAYRSKRAIVLKVKTMFKLH